MPALRYIGSLQSIPPILLLYIREGSNEESGKKEVLQD